MKLGALFADTEAVAGTGAPGELGDPAGGGLLATLPVGEEPDDPALVLAAGLLTAGLGTAGLGTAALAVGWAADRLDVHADVSRSIPSASEAPQV